MIETICWVLPRPRRKNKYKGGFPMHFEKKLFELYKQPKRILQPFGGMAEYGERVDMNPGVKPDYIGNAHNMDFLQDNTYDFVLLDPPYSCDLSGKLYNIGNLHYYKFVDEAVRVCKKGGFIAIYHWFITPRPEGTKYHRRIFIGLRIWHHVRVCTIFQKDNL